jgi:hypothetical protein
MAIASLPSFGKKEEEEEINSSSEKEFVKAKNL